jgi:hypothetical protein
MNQASYDLDRLRVNGLITRIAGRNFYRLTGDGLWFAIFYTKVHDRLLRPLLAAAVGSCRGGRPSSARSAALLLKAEVQVSTCRKD